MVWYGMVLYGMMCWYYLAVLPCKISDSSCESPIWDKIYNGIKVRDVRSVTTYFIHIDNHIYINETIINKFSNLTGTHI